MIELIIYGILILISPLITKIIIGIVTGEKIKI